MNIENIQKMWEKDSHINPDKYEEESTKIPQLHQRYMEHFNTFSLMKREKELELNQLRKEKWVYYKGKAPSSVYKFQPFDLKLTTSDEIKSNYKDWKKKIGKVLDADDIAKTIEFAYSLPQDICIRNLVIASTRQEP